MNSERFIKLCLILAVLNISAVAGAQDGYRLLLKGERNPYDTAVATRIDKYRMDSRRISFADSLIQALQVQADSQALQLQIDSMLIRSFEFQEMTRQAQHDSTLHTLQDLSRSFDQVVQVATEPKKWWELAWMPDWVKYLVGFGVGWAVFK